jgi:hypothetical protein
MAGGRWCRRAQIAAYLGVAAGSSLLGHGLPARAQSSTGLVPLSELAMPYLGSGEPGLYPGGANLPTGPHLARALAAATQVVPRDAAGAPAVDGWIGFVGVGMSNANQEWARFERDHDPAGHAGRVVLADLAQGGIDALLMADPNNSYWLAFDNRLAAAGLAPQQVQVVWLKQTLQAIGQPTFPQEVETLRAALRSIVDNLRQRLPNLALVFLSARAYGGWSGGGEPWAYQSAFAMKGIISDQIAGLFGLDTGPWIGWGPYLWADGVNPRADGLTWQQADFEADGTHPSASGEQKVADRLAAFLPASGLANWLVADDGTVVRALAASDDAYVDPAQPASNFGTGAALRWDDGRRIHLRFSLAGVPQPVYRAKLSLLSDALDGSPTGNIYLASSTAWSEATITAASEPGFVPTPGPLARGASRGGAVDVDLTTQVQAALTAGADAIGLVLVRGAAGGTASEGFVAREGGDAPRLVLTLDRSLFADGFESGDNVAWDAAATN